MRSVTTKNPFLLLPNMIDYFRLLFLISSICVFTTYPWIGIGLYVINSFCDMLDGTIARALGQQSKLGTLLDFSIDRAAITILFSGCIWVDPHYWGFFVAVMALDIMTHFAVCYAAVFNGGSHLDFIAQGSWLLKQFSQKNAFKYFICTSHDGFFAIFIAYFLHPSPYWWILWIVLFPGMLLKLWIHIEQFYLAALITSLK